MKDVLNRIYNYSLEEIMGDRFERYAKEIIQDRALPDVRDGLKPVQRRILFGMYQDHNTYDKPTKKSAKTVGNVMGNYHPHGDSSIYEAMVHLSQWWKQNTILIDMQGNNGSIDGDGPAAMRYTEARLAKISNELLKDLDKATVPFAPNYDDTLEEPTVLPAKFPNLLVNGTTGISAGYATNIPPHNLGEIIDATIKRIDSPNCYLDTILDIVKGPDFPTGGICFPKKGLLDAYTSGKGKVFIRSKYEVTKNKGKEQIIITEIPFAVNKANLVKKIDEIRIDKKVDGISEVRDESDKEIRIAIDLKKDSNKDLIINYLLKNTDMQVSYSYNMVAIVNRRPMTLGILPILDAYIAHQKEVILKRTNFDLAFFKKQLHIIEGLVNCISILDEVIRVIRASKNKGDAKDNLVKEFDFTEEQAEAIVTLQLYRLTNTDVTELLEKKSKYEIIIKGLEELLQDENKLKNRMKEELRQIKREYATPRKTEIRDELEEVKIDASAMIPKEDVIVVVTKEGYVKRVSLRSYNKEEETLVKEKDYIILMEKVNTMDVLLLFTNKGNYLYVPVHEIPELKWKELGKHISNVIKIDEGEKIVGAKVVNNFEEDKYVTIFTKNGMVKRTSLKEYKAIRYSKPIVTMKLKEDDEVVSTDFSNKTNVFVGTYRGYALTYKTDEIPVSGLKTSGVKAINLKDDHVVSAYLFEDEMYTLIITSKGTFKRVKISEFELTSRARRGIQMIREVKTNPYYILKTILLDSKEEIGFVTLEDIFYKKQSEISISDRHSVGTSITKEKIEDVFLKSNLIDKKEEIEKEDEIEILDLDEIDKKIYTIEDFLDNMGK